MRSRPRVAAARLEAQIAVLRRRLEERYQACGSLADPEVIALSQQLDWLMLPLLRAEAGRRRRSR